MMTPKLRRVVASLFILISLAGFSVYSESRSQDQVSPAQDSSDSISASDDRSAAMALERLEVKGRAPKTGYSRDQFGNGWAEINGCDLRNLILQRDLTGAAIDEEDGCAVMSGLLDDPYTGKQISFVRGQGTSNSVQIDHIVALSDAWQKGAQLLSGTERDKFANDSLNLLAVDGPANMQKGDSDAASWLPPNKQYRCRYVARQIAVKVEYVLWVTDAEKSAIQRVLSSCPAQELPAIER
jgi:hypothetical protein